MEEQLNQAAPSEAEVGGDDAAMDEHRAALAKMRTAYALEQLYAASGAKDPSVLGRLIDVEEGDVHIGADGIPDVSAVRTKIDALRRKIVLHQLTPTVFFSLRNLCIPISRQVHKIALIINNEIIDMNGFSGFFTNSCKILSLQEAVNYRGFTNIGFTGKSNFR